MSHIGEMVMIEPGVKMNGFLLKLAGKTYTIPDAVEYNYIYNCF